MVGTLNGAMKVYVDAYAADTADVLVGYKGPKRVDVHHPLSHIVLNANPSGVVLDPQH